MKKFLLLIVCTLFVLSVSAQRASGGQITSPYYSSNKSSSSDKAVSFGVRASLDFSSMRVSTKGDGESSDYRVGFHVGAISDIKLISGYFYLQPGIYFSMKGYEDANPFYIDIPILLSGRYSFNKDVQVQLNFGPYFGVGLFGENDYFDYYRRFDCGLSLSGGVLLAQHYFISIGYEFGLYNCWENRYNIKARNNDLMITLGYNF